MIQQVRGVSTTLCRDDLLKWNHGSLGIPTAENPCLAAQEIGCEIVAVEEARGADPCTSSVPPFHIGRSEEYLSK